MSDTPETMTGAEWLARTIHATGTTHVFWIDAVLRRTLVELGVLGVTRVLAHSEKSAVYMADGFARITGRPALCFAQSVGAANLAAGLQDPVSRPQPRHCADRPQDRLAAAPQCLPGTAARAAVRRRDEVRRRSRCRRRPAATAAAGVARSHDRLAAAGASRPQRAARRSGRVGRRFRNPSARARRSTWRCRRIVRRRRPTTSRARRRRCSPPSGSRSSPVPAPPHRAAAPNSSLSASVLPRRSAFRSALTASSRHAMRLPSAPSATTRRRPPTGSSTTPISCCSSAATPAIR